MPFYGVSIAEQSRAERRARVPGDLSIMKISRSLLAGVGLLALSCAGLVGAAHCAAEGRA